MGKNLNLKILQWNCRSINNKLDFRNVAGEYDIILLIETWLNADSILFKESHFSLKGLKTVRFDRNFNKGGGLAICIKSGIIYERVNLNFSGKSVETGSVIVDSILGEI